MEELALQFFPYPHVFRGKRREGALCEWPERCQSCPSRSCEEDPSKETKLCSFGLNYRRIDETLLVAGLVVTDYPTDTPARSKMRRKNRANSISSHELERVVQLAGEATDRLEADLQASRDEVIAEYRESKGYQQDVLKGLRPQLEQTLAQVHDYKQFVQQIIQNLIVLLESEFPGLPLEEKLEKARHEETAIYWAAVVMDEKLDAALFLESPQRIYEKREWKRFRLHGMVIKYIKIYKSRADRKKVSVLVSGESWGLVEGNARAFGIIPHTLIDNALKYAPEGSKVYVDFIEDKDQIDLVVSSRGPRIRSDEHERIFDLFYRGAAARRRYKDGTGFGLASAQNIARAHDTKIEVEQRDEPDENGDYETAFRIRFEKSGVASPL